MSSLMAPHYPPYLHRIWEGPSACVFNQDCADSTALAMLTSLPEEEGQRFQGPRGLPADPW